MESINIVSLQYELKADQYLMNMNTVKKLFQSIAKKNVDIIILPELCFAGHFFTKSTSFTLDTITNGPAFDFMQKYSAKNNWMIAYGIKEKDKSGKLYSTSVLIDQGELIGYYRKEHPPCVEKVFFNNGINETNIFKTRFGNIMLLICYDMSFTESYTRQGNKDIDIVLVSNAWIKMEKMPYLEGKKFENHITLPRAIAIQNRCLVAVATPVGSTKFIVPNFPMFGDGIIPFDTEFCGNSLICDHTGSILAMADGHSETALYCSCSTQFSQQMKKIDFESHGLHQLAAALSKEEMT
jgi:predicted amidohydrolase